MQESTTQNRLMLSGLQPQTMYDVRLYVECENGYSDTVVITFSTGCLAGGEFTVGNGTLFDNDLPTNGYYRYSITQQIYTAAEMYGASIGDSVLVQGICPNGWHLPSGTEWGMLISHMESQSQYHCSGNSANIAKALAADQYWMTSSESCAVGNDLSANNATGFSMLPAGEWELHNGQCTNFWTSSYQGLSSNGIYHKAQTMELMYFMPRLSTNTRSHNEVLSVRCLRNY